MSNLSPAAILFDTAGSEKGVSGNPVVVTGTVTSAERDAFGSVVGASRYNQIEVDFSTLDPDAITRITVTKSNGGDATHAAGQASFSTGTATNGGIKAVSNLSSAYRPQAESYAAFTAIFTAGVADAYQRIGIYDSSNGFFLGFEGTSFGVTLRKGGVDTTTARASFNIDTLTGAAGSKFTRAGVAEALDPTKDNLYRIRYGWLGAAPIVFEVFSPDGEWIAFHVIKHPNTVDATSVDNPNLPITLDAQKTAGSTNVVMKTACWAAGSTSDLAEITANLTNTSLAKLTRSVITGEVTGGGGGFANVKVSPSGALTTEIDDGGGSITVDGTVTANQGTAATLSGRWPVQVTDGTNTLPTADVSARALFAKVTDGTNTLGVNASGQAAIQNPPNLDVLASTLAKESTQLTLLTEAEFEARVNTLGQKTSAASTPVVIASDQSDVQVAQGDPATLAGRWPVQVTDGTNTMPTGDVVARSVFQKISDGVTGPVAVKSASTAALASDLSLVTALSPNSPLPAGSNELGVVKSRLSDADLSPIRATVSQELKVAQLYTLADLTNKYELDTRLFDSFTTTGGTTSHVPTQSAVRTAVTGASGATAALCSNTFYKYQSGYTQFVSISVINSDLGHVNQVRQWGYFDDNDGLFFQVSGTALSIVERTSATGSVAETTYAQAAWNVDPMNGTGPSGLTLDVSKGNIYEIELQWFGVGATRYFVNGVLVHKVQHANALATVYMRTANLPVQLRVTNTGASASGSLTLVCARVAAQGQTQEPHEWAYGVANPTEKVLSVSEAPILSIRPKALYNTIVNRAWLIPHHMTVSTEDYKISYKLIYGATLTGASWTSVDARSAAEYDVSATAYTGGELLLRSFIPGPGSENMNLDHFFRINGRMLRRAGFAGAGTNVDDVLTIVAVNTAVGNTKVKADMAWTEVR